MLTMATVIHSLQLLTKVMEYPDVSLRWLPQSAVLSELKWVACSVSVVVVVSALQLCDALIENMLKKPAEKVSENPILL